MSLNSDANSSPIAGEDYTLECSAASSVVMFNWLGPPDGRTHILANRSLIVHSNSSTSWLHFSPIQHSHNGLYSCVAVTDEDRLSSEPIKISVNGKSQDLVYCTIMLLLLCILLVLHTIE